MTKTPFFCGALMIYYDKSPLFSHSTISISIINQPLTNFISNSTLVGKVLSVLNGHCIASLWESTIQHFPFHPLSLHVESENWRFVSVLMYLYILFYACQFASSIYVCCIRTTTAFLINSWSAPLLSVIAWFWSHKLYWKMAPDDV